MGKEKSCTGIQKKGKAKQWEKQ